MTAGTVAGGAVRGGGGAETVAGVDRAGGGIVWAGALGAAPDVIGGGGIAALVGGTTGLVVGGGGVGPGIGGTAGELGTVDDGLHPCASSFAKGTLGRQVSRLYGVLTDESEVTLKLLEEAGVDRR